MSSRPTSEQSEVRLRATQTRAPAGSAPPKIHQALRCFRDVDPIDAPAVAWRPASAATLADRDIKRAKRPGSHPNPTAQLWEAAETGDAASIDAALRNGATIDAKTADGRTALMRAAVNGHTACLKALLDAGADSEAKDQDGQTALMLAALYGHTSALKALLAAGADKEVKDQYGRTALLLAANLGHTSCLKALLDAGADSEAKSKDGWTALMLARRSEHQQCVELLEADNEPPDASLDAELDAALASSKRRYADRRLRLEQDAAFEASALRDRPKGLAASSLAREARLRRSVGADPELQGLLAERDRLRQEGLAAELRALKTTAEAQLATLNAEERQQRAELERRRLEEDHACPVCLEVKASLGVAYDCGHRVCKACARRVGRQCPVCRQESEAAPRPIYASISKRGTPDTDARSI